MDAYMQEQFPGSSFDKDSLVAKAGTVNKNLLAALKEHDFFKQAFPKTTGPELFNLHYLQQAKQTSGTASLSAEDTMATLNRFSADMIVVAIKDCLKDKSEIKIFCSGGGIHNPLLMQHLQEQLPAGTFLSTAETGVNPDAKEAVLFALLANECVCSDVSIAEIKSPGIPAVAMGKIRFPA
jgi:anhydro-N-acetylmuramic acid kinase